MKFTLKQIIILFLSFYAFAATSQSTIVRGTIMDAKTKEAIPFATVFFDESNFGTTTDSVGHFVLETDKYYTKLKVLMIGYKPYSRELIPGKDQTINCKLTAEEKMLNEVTINSKSARRYRNKDNPAVELIRKVIDHKASNRIEGFDYYEYEKYEKIQFALSNITEKFQNRRAFKKFQFVFENLDTTKLEGKPVLPLYLKEVISDARYRKSPNAKKEIVKGSKTVAFEGYVDNQGLDAYMNNLYQDINIYDNNITMLTNQFISPIAGISPTFYKFFITDTIIEGDEKFIRLGFVPRNHADFLFQGIMHITLDGSYAVTKIEMSVNKDINLNWVKELKIRQEFEKKENQGYTLVTDEFSADFGLSKGKMGIFGQRTVSYKNFKLNKPRPDADYKGDLIEVNDSANYRPMEFWIKNRHSDLTASEKSVYTMVDSIKKVPAFKRTLDVIVLVFAGYKTITPYFDCGPLSTFYSFNPIEGFRLRFGGRTTDAFSKRMVLEGYSAYGFKDQQWKYYGGVAFSLNNHSVYEFPVSSLKFSYQRETKIPGQELQFIQEDNILLSFKRGPNDKWLYNNTFNFEYLQEFKNHLSFTLGFKNWIQQAAGGLNYNRTDYTDYTSSEKNLQTSEVSLNIRWAPNEKFYQGKKYRIPVTFKNPIFTLRYIQGIKYFLGGQYDYQNISLNMSKRFYLSQLGYSDIAIEGGKIFGTVPFPLLDIHRANQTYAYQLQSYNLMNFLEFVSDQYVSLNIDHFFNGFFFNKIPLLRKLKWREVISAKVLYGSLSANNNPSNNSTLYKLPTTLEGVPITHSLEKKPYVEGSVGITNIFKFFRVDLVKRFTYLDHPDISKLGIRVRFRFDF
ncbi:DUF5686 and carboxypeptidase-like regulatory domain-containing protein [Aurantibacillus circumpalustris]|uniref:DUF5686 and carboxypeptidase-like regulatory domain-containing protein n=1 Tax=Aurantibacillus circumpalustris TaxID=3036359 RepID=UPI00295B35D0|nr:DUF5686 family protein [Aurantibacillus circumpalustris]